MRVKSIRPAGEAAVYNMEVPGTHSFVVQGGYVAHNCYDECRYVLMERPIAPPPAPEKRPIPDFDPLDMFPKTRSRW